jgi:hypothetical protein
MVNEVYIGKRSLRRVIRPRLKTSDSFNQNQHAFEALVERVVDGKAKINPDDLTELANRKNTKPEVSDALENGTGLFYKMGVDDDPLVRICAARWAAMNIIFSAFIENKLPNPQREVLASALKTNPDVAEQFLCFQSAHNSQNGPAVLAQFNY